MPAITYLKPNGEWGVSGVDLSTLPPKVYGALCKLKDLEHPMCGTNLERLATLDLEGAAQFITVIATVAASTERTVSVADVKDCVKAWLSSDIDLSGAPGDLVEQWLTGEPR